MKNVLVICGGQSSEHIVSRMSATSVINNIDKSKYNVTIVGIDTNGAWHKINTDIKDLKSDTWLDNSMPVLDVLSLLKEHVVAFPVLHGLYGEDGTIQGLFELAKIPYVGFKVLGSSTSMDKIYTKKILNTAGIKQVPSLYVRKRYDDKLVVVTDDFDEIFEVEDEIERTLGFPCFIKASNSGSSVGCYCVNQKSELIKALISASEYDRKIVVEKYVDCIELECAILGNDDIIASRVGQIMPHGEFYTFESKYEDKESKTCIPAKVDESIQEEIRKQAKKVFKAMDGRGLARVDFFLDKETNEVYLNELNTMPGFTNISMYPELIMDLGYTYSELLDRLIDLALEG